MPHHSQYDSTSQHRNYTLAGVKELRPKLYEALARDQHREKLVATGRISSWPQREAAHQVFSSIEAKAMRQSTLSAVSVS
jgi:hypothetical protein